MSAEKKPSKVELLKEKSAYLYGPLAEEMQQLDKADITKDAYEIMKFHGSYLQYDRDTATERKQQKLDKEWSFMLRLKMPGGRITAKQYLELDSLADRYANGTLRITTRETFQYHGVLKGDVKPQIRAINDMLLSTLGGCGDVVRNIATTSAPIRDAIHDRLWEDTKRLAEFITPKTSAYHEIWLDGENVARTPDNDNLEDMYGKHYLPRKFKISLSVPEDNSMDALTHDLAFILVFEGEKLLGYNIYLGGGMGMTHNMPDTFPRIASPIAFVGPDELLPACKAVIELQRDHGDRSNRKRARLKYVVEDNGIEWTRKELEKYFGRRMHDPVPVPPFKIVDHMGWHSQKDGRFYLGVPVSSGRIVDRGAEKIRTGLRAVIEQWQCDVVLTADQNIILCNLQEPDREPIEAMLRSYSILLNQDVTSLYRNAIACVAMPTCGKALAEAERVKLPVVAELEKIMAKYGVGDSKIAVRLAGCPNGCSRPYVGDIGIVGRMPGFYAIFIGGDFEGTRLNSKIAEKVAYEEIGAVLEPYIERYAKERSHADEGFGDFWHRVGFEQAA